MKSSASTSSRQDRRETPKAPWVAQQIKARARDIGFDLVGITTAQSPQHSQHLRQWLAMDFHGEMRYMARNTDKRVNPSEILADVRSIVVVGLNYYTRDHDQAGRVARSAWGAGGYHEEKSGEF